MGALRRILAWVLVAVAGGCGSTGRSVDAVRAYYAYDFAAARSAVREAAEVQDDNVVLNTLRLGAAALADGDQREAERALGKGFEWLSTAGLNADRTTASILLHEGVRIWKGEPFEQALAYSWIASLYAVNGDWENVRAAAANSLFRLTDFGKDRSMEEMSQEAARDDDFLERGYEAVDTNFALGFLLQALASDLSGAPGSDALYDQAMKIDEELEPVIETLRQRDFDTLLIVDFGKGPTKMAHGPDDALVRFAPQDSGSGPIMVTVGGARGLSYPPVCDVNALAQDHRWRNLDDVRHAKSVIGDVLVIGGAGVIAASNHGRHSSETGTLVGAGMILAGIISKAGASADTRYMEFAPQRVYLVPLQLGEPTNVDLRVADGPEPGLVLPWLRPGTREAPRAVYLRLHGRDSVQPAWLSARERRHGNDWSGVRPGDWPWILGGNDVSTPGAQSLRAYQVGGYLREMTEGELLDLYEAEGIALESGAVPVGEQLDDSAWRHVLEGGRALFLPAPDSVGYKRLMYSDHAPYTSRSEILRNALTEIRVGAAPRE